MAKEMSFPKRLYLVAYNALSALLWSFVLVRTLAILHHHGLTDGAHLVYPTVGQWTKWTQTIAGLEVAHSLLGIVRAPLATTLMQVLSRFALVWGAVHSCPSVAASPAYSSMLLAWSATEVVRYLFFALALVGCGPAPLRWLRYSAFYLLYPVGISSELYELFLASRVARLRGQYAFLATIAVVMAFYLPGAPVLYGHMMRQRKKVLGAPAREKTE